MGKEKRKIYRWRLGREVMQGRANALNGVLNGPKSHIGIEKEKKKNCIDKDLEER